MSLTVYVGHSVAEAETAFLWEFQANAAAHGIRVVLAKYQPVASLTPSRMAQIQAADAFLAVVTQPAPDVEAEAHFASDQKRPIFVYTWQGVHFNAPSDAVVFRLTQQTDAPTLLADVAAKLKKLPARNDDLRKALGVVIGVGAALFLLSLLDKK